MEKKSLQVSEEKIHFFIQNLKDWYVKNRRKLPFRETKDPYRIWISEIMLQQTRMGAVLNALENKYTNFIKRFPDLASLASATEEEVLDSWRGLGYYNRARNLLKAAKIIYTDFQGKFPDTYHHLRSLPGIGDYTASAILSIAFELPYPVFDGNAVRVHSRFFYSSVKNGKDIRELAGYMISLPEVIPSLYNQAVMELGSTICHQRFPGCADCPLRERCDVFSLPLEEKVRIPETPKKQQKETHLRIYIIRKNGEFLLTRNSIILKNHYFFPFELDDGNREFEKYAVPAGTVYHSIMHYKIKAGVFSVTDLKFLEEYGFLKKLQEKLWVHQDDFRKYLFTSFSKKVLDIYYSSLLFSH